jgi:hypothetical protein
MLPGDFTVSEGHGHPLVSLKITSWMIEGTTWMVLTKVLYNVDEIIFGDAND